MTAPPVPEEGAGPVLEDTDPWVTLGADIAATIARDRAQGMQFWESQKMADLVRAYLNPWLTGVAQVQMQKLLNALDACQRFKQSYELAELETAQRWLTLEAQLTMAGEINRAGYREVVFVLRREGDRFGSPLVSTRGNASRSWILGRDIDDGCLLLHNHPTGDLSPSDADLEAMGNLNGLAPHCGDGIISQDACRLYMIRDPRPLPPVAGAA